MNPIVERIEREAGVPGLTSILAERLTPTDLQSLLLEVYRRRASHRQPADVLSEYQTNRFVVPSAVSPWSVVVEIPRDIYRTPLVASATGR